ncbi:hypothetical protein LJC71_11670, partial [Desulfosarcina sp. OttesenSCG-928-A07]|nr:hypothetical protein [Desulfosarcina sp. OttesenSCG-928-A07]
GYWDLATANWYEDSVPATAITFLDGDAVTFANTIDATINIQGTQKTVAQMLVTGSGDLTLNGSIRADASKSTLSLTPSGQLQKPGTGALTLNGTSRFTNEINLNGGTTKLGSGSVLENTSGTLYVGKSGTAALDLSAGGMATSAGGISIGELDGSRGSVTVNGKNAVLENTSGALYVGKSGMGQLDLSAGGKATSADDIYIGELAGAKGTVTVNGANSVLENTSGALYVGKSGMGQLDLSAGGKATSADDIYIGELAGAKGTVTVNGANSILENMSGALYVGKSGTGKLDLSAGGRATSAGDIYMGHNANSSGAVTVASGSTLGSSSGKIFVGGTASAAGGAGLLAGTGNIASDVTVWSTGTLSPGDRKGALGTLVITGNLDMKPGSTLLLDLGASNASDRIVVNGTASVDSINIDLTSLQNGTYTVITSTGLTSSGSHSFKLNGLEFAGRATSTITPVSDANNFKFTIAGSGSNKSLTWNGPATGEWDLATTNWYANNDPGTPITFLDGDEVTFANDTNATVNIQGTQKLVAKMSVTGAGDLSINGNILSTSQLLKTNTGTGTLTLNGTGSFRYEISLDGGITNIGSGSVLESRERYIFVGTNSNTGVLNLTAGGKASAASSIQIGRDANSNGTVTVDGADSLLENKAGTLHIGDSGTGKLDITDGGKATSASHISIGNNATGDGAVTVNGSGSELKSTGGELHIGANGTGKLDLTDGGKATSLSFIAIGNKATSKGVVTVDGAGSLLESMEHNLYVGANGTGKLDLTDGGKAISASNI